MKKLLTILGDSLTMPRQEVLFTSTYPYILNEKISNNFFLANNSHRGNSIVNLLDIDNKTGYRIEDIDYYNESTYIIVHLGIVDCAPRIFSEKEYLKLQNRFFGRFIIKIKEKYRFFFTKYFPKVYTDINTFESQYNQLIDYILQTTRVKKILIINIADTNQKNKLKSYNFEKNIDDYNLVLSEIALKNQRVELIDINSISKQKNSFLLDDGIHLSIEAHQAIANIIYEKVIL